MKKLWLLFAVFISIIGCHSDKLNDIALSDAAPEANQAMQTINKDSWSLQIPASWSEYKKEDSPNIAYFKNGVGVKSLIVIQQMIDPETKSLQDLASVSLRYLRQDGSEVLSLDLSNINGINFVLIESEKNNIIVWSWQTIINNNGYGILCAGTESNRDVCLTIANSFTIDNGK